MTGIRSRLFLPLPAAASSFGWMVFGGGLPKLRRLALFVCYVGALNCAPQRGALPSLMASSNLAPMCFEEFVCRSRFLSEVERLDNEKVP